MNQENLFKLHQFLESRKSKLESVAKFFEDFDQFAFLYLKDAVQSIDNELQLKTSDSLRFFSENPYEKNGTHFFVMVQLFKRTPQRNGFYLDQSNLYPSIQFQGDEFSGMVKVTIKQGAKIFSTTTYPVAELCTEGKNFELLLGFLETIYTT